MYNIETLTDQQALEFSVPELTHFEREVYEQTLLEDIRFRQLVDVDNSADDWARTVEYRSIARAGNAEWYNAQANEVPVVSMEMDRHTQPIHMAAIGYNYDIETTHNGARLGVNIMNEGINGAIEESERFMQKVCYEGDATKGFHGLLDHPNVTRSTATQTIASSTAEEMVALVQAPIAAIVAQTLERELPNYILLPTEQYDKLAETQFNQYNTETVMDYVKRTNATTTRTGRNIEIMAISQLQGKGAGSTDRMVVYSKDPGKAKMHIPMEHRFVVPMRTGPLTYHRPGIFRVGGFDLRREASMRYVDGV